MQRGRNVHNFFGIINYPIDEIILHETGLIEASNARLMNEDANYRLISFDGEIPFYIYMRIDNSELSAAETAKKIKEYFGL